MDCHSLALEIGCIPHCMDVHSSQLLKFSIEVGLVVVDVPIGRLDIEFLGVVEACAAS